MEIYTSYISNEQQYITISLNKKPSDGGGMIILRKQRYGALLLARDQMRQ